MTVKLEVVKLQEEQMKIPMWDDKQSTSNVGERVVKAEAIGGTMQTIFIKGPSGKALRNALS